MAADAAAPAGAGRNEMAAPRNPRGSRLGRPATTRPQSFRASRLNNIFYGNHISTLASCKITHKESSLEFIADPHGCKSLRAADLSSLHIDRFSAFAIRAGADDGSLYADITLAGALTCPL
jgi:hypothetical protein